MVETSMSLATIERTTNLFGNLDENINLINRKLDVKMTQHDSVLKIIGEEGNVDNAVKVINGLLQLIDKGETITEQDVRYVMSLVDDGLEDNIKSISSDVICTTVAGKPIKPKTLGQKGYVESIRNNTITICVSPAGTGKSYLAVASAVREFRAHNVKKIILTRPAVEAGEKLGFLPGDLQHKVDPYLRPLYDALFDMFGVENYQKYVEKGCIEVAPLAYMRGRTLNDSFIILDEAQNTTQEQMKMFLTRLGFNSRMVINGDVTQIDLSNPKASGLFHCSKILKGIKGIGISVMSEKDVVRHKLVQDIVKAYEKADVKEDPQ